MTKPYLLFFLGLLWFASCKKREIHQIDYTITQIHKDSLDVLQVDLSFVPSPEGTTILEYPNEAWGQENLHDALLDVTVLGASNRLEMNRDSGWIVINHPENLEELQVKYVLKQDFEEPITSRKIYRPIIQPEYFHVFSHNLFMMPSLDRDTLDVQLEWKGLREGEVVHNSFGSGENKQNLMGIHKDEFLEAIFVGGDFKIQEIAVRDNLVHLATRGDWIPFTVDQIKELLQETLRCQRDFWEDHSQSYFTVTMQPIFSANGSSYQGTGLTNSFATSFSNNEYMEIGQMVHLFNHELMHNWIGGAITNANEEEQYWFSEGFTEYYTFKNVAQNRINQLGADHYIKEINATITKLYSSPVLAAPNSEINYNNFWTSQDYSQLPYYRGAVFAFYLDQQIRRRSNGSKSLDDVMRQILQDAQEKNQTLGHAYFVSVLEPYIGDDFERFFEKHIVQGDSMPLELLFDQLDLEFSDTSAIYELGFTLSEDKTTIVAVVENSAAQMAGLKVGDKLVSQDMWYGAMDIPVKLGVNRKGESLNLEFYPVTQGKVPQMAVSPENLSKLGFN